ncbi:unnamed protein product [Ostreobium quekettii]|uniref:Uncharacterized protein n=1 Tax=Ostreobium quekettii TaxID=121088 RepID=A0A8S1J0W6_9CHLO|nr:unnamed protein product [Ostreobium quekettii]
MERPLPWGGSVSPVPQEVVARRSDSRAWAPSTSATRAEALRKYQEAPAGNTMNPIWTGKLDSDLSQGNTGGRPEYAEDDEDESHLPAFKRTTTAWKEVVAKRSDTKAWAPSTSASRAEALRKYQEAPAGNTMNPIWTGKMDADARCSSVSTSEAADDDEDESYLPAFKRKTTAWKGKLEGKGRRKKVEESYVTSVARPLPWGGAVGPIPQEVVAKRRDTKAWAPSTSASRAEALRVHAEAPAGNTMNPIWTGKMDAGAQNGREKRASSVSTPSTPGECQGEDDEDAHLPRFKKTTTAWKGKLEGKNRAPDPPAHPWAASVARPLPWGGAVAQVPPEARARRSNNKAWAPSTSVARADELRKELKYLDVIQQQMRMGRRSAELRPTPPNTPPLAGGGQRGSPEKARSASVEARSIPDGAGEWGRDELCAHPLDDGTRSAEEWSIDERADEGLEEAADARGRGSVAEDVSRETSVVGGADGEAEVGMVCGDADDEKALFLGKASFAGVIAAAEELVEEAKQVVSAAERDVADMAAICEDAKEKEEEEAEAQKDAEAEAEGEANANAGVEAVSQGQTLLPAAVLDGGVSAEAEQEAPVCEVGEGESEEAQSPGAAVGGSAVGDAEGNVMEALEEEKMDDGEGTGPIGALADVSREEGSQQDARLKCEGQDVTAPEGLLPCDVQEADTSKEVKSLAQEPAAGPAALKEAMGAVKQAFASRLPRPPTNGMVVSGKKEADNVVSGAALGEGVQTSSEREHATESVADVGNFEQVVELKVQSNEGTTGAPVVDAHHKEHEAGEETADVSGRDGCTLAALSASVSKQDGAEACEDAAAGRPKSPAKKMGVAAMWAAKHAAAQKENTVMVPKPAVKKGGVAALWAAKQAEAQKENAEAEARVAPKRMGAAAMWAARQADAQTENMATVESRPPVKKVGVTSTWAAKQAEGDKEAAAASGPKATIERGSVPTWGAENVDNVRKVADVPRAKSPLKKNEPEGAEDGKMDVRMMCKLFAQMGEK